MAAGLITAGGSGLYLADSFDQDISVGVSLKYGATTHTETLPMLMCKDNNLCNIKVKCDWFF